MSALKVRPVLKTSPQNNCSWALDFIKAKNLKAETLRNSASFRELSRSQKDAIRYQLKKAKEKPTRDSLLWSRRGDPSSKLMICVSITIGVAIAALLLFDFYRFYLSEGLSPLRAFGFAVTVELCILLSAASFSQKLKNLGKILIVYNAVIFFLLGLNQFEELKSKRKLQVQRAAQISAQINDFKKEKAQIKTQMNKLFDRGLVTSTVNSLGNTLERKDKRITELQRELLETRGSGLNRSVEVSPVVALVLMGLLRVLLQCFSFYLVHACVMRFKTLSERSV